MPTTAMGLKGPQPPSKNIILNKNSVQYRGLIFCANLAALYGSYNDYPSGKKIFNLATPSRGGTHDTANIDGVIDPVVGPGINFPDNSLDEITISDWPAVEGIDRLTVSVWTRKAGFTNNIVWGKHSSGTTGSFYLATINATTVRFAVVNASSSRIDHDVTYSMTAGVLYHIVGVYDGSYLRVYINGIERGSPSAQTGNIKNSTQNLVLGGYEGAGFQWNGTVIDPRIYNRALSASEVWAMYNPATRWDLYSPIAPTMWVLAGAAAPTPPDGDPTNLALDVVSSSRIDLSWTDGSTNEDGFSIERSTDGVTFAEIDTVAADAESYSDTSCSPNTLYYYRVRAYNGEGYSNYTDTESAKTPPDDVSLQQYLVWDGSQIRQTDYRYLALVDGVPEPDTVAGVGWIYIDEDDGDLKCKFSDGTITVIAADT